MDFVGFYSAFLYIMKLLWFVDSYMQEPCVFGGIQSQLRMIQCFV